MDSSNTKDVCKEEPKQRYVDVPEEKCVDVPEEKWVDVPRGITKDVCNEEPEQPCMDVPREHCKEVVNKLCTTMYSHRQLQTHVPDICKEILELMEEQVSHEVCEDAHDYSSIEISREMSKVVKHDDDQNADHDGYTSAEVTEGTMENNSKAWTASIPTKPDWNEAATELKLNSNIKMGPTQTCCCCKTRPQPSPGTRPTQQWR